MLNIPSNYEDIRVRSDQKFGNMCIFLNKPKGEKKGAIGYDERPWSAAAQWASQPFILLLAAERTFALCDDLPQVLSIGSGWNSFQIRFQLFDHAR